MRGILDKMAPVEKPDKIRFFSPAEVAGLLLLFSLGLLLRIYNSGGPGLWLDEIWSVYLSRLPLGQMLKLVSETDVHPPLYYLLLKGLKPLGQNEFLLRGYSALLDLAALPLLYLLARRLAGARPAWFACGFLACSSLHLVYSQDVRMYTLLATLLLGSYALFWQICNLPKPHPGYFLAYFGTSLAALYLNNFAIIQLAAQGIILLLVFNRRENWLKMAPLWAVTGLFYLPWLLSLPNQFTNINHFNQPGLFILFDSLASFGGVDHVNGPLHFNLLVVEQPWLLLGMVILTVAGLRNLASQKPERRFLLIFWLVPLLVSWWVSQYRPLYADRAFMASSFPFFIILGAAFKNFSLEKRGAGYRFKSFGPEKGLVLGGSLVMLVLMAASLWLLLVGGGYIRHDVRGLDRAASEELAGETNRAFLLFTAFAGAPPAVFDYYSPVGAEPLQYGFPTPVKQRLEQGRGKVCGVFTALGSTWNDPLIQQDLERQIENFTRWLSGRAARLTIDSRYPDGAIQLRCWQIES